MILKSYFLSSLLLFNDIVQNFIAATDTLGTSLFQCPNGYFLSKFNTAFDGTERYYKFSCTKFAVISSIDEVCTMSDAASTIDEDIYMSCGSEQYTAGIEILEDPTDGSTTWQLLCCNSDSIQLRNSDCIDTKFINDLRRPSSFSSGSQIIRKWQAMTENNDLRWWLQLCPVDVTETKRTDEKSQPIRARRHLPRAWSRGRFAPLEYFPAYMGHSEPLVNEEKFFNQKRMKLIEKTNQIQNSFEDDIDDKPAFITEPPTTVRKESKEPNNREDTALDYYDTYDDNFDRAKHEGKGGFLSGVSDLLQNLQDGISLAQAVMPNNNPQNFATKSTTAPLPSLMLSRDDNALTIGVQDGGPNKRFDSIIKLQKIGPNPPRPTGSEQTTTPVTTLKLGDPSAIQQMLQFFGLCKGHEL
ncbi:unnamed protein product [Enterobius vermicularis]|uniref:Ricin B-type lectin domain-containing protein n=1 Tax=Enterobius vermicularis TaxID=51028 RepID=A0A0N4V654_ENTVE|nr:unnamed protein product [Enterobius vermicularis]